MQDGITERLADLGRRCGLKDASPRAAGAFLVVCALALAWGLWRWWPQDVASQPRDVEAEEVPTAARGDSVTGHEAHAGNGITQKPSESQSLVVHVVGAVRRPGVYTLGEGSRVRDAIDLAGGMLPDAVPALINLARPVSDGEQVVVPTEDDAAKSGAAGAAAGASAGGTGAGLAMPGGAGGDLGAPVDINTADVALLDTLPGIGPSTAQKIVADREANGPFASVEDLGRISGIGPKRLEQLKGLACVR